MSVRGCVGIITNRGGREKEKMNGEKAGNGQGGGIGKGWLWILAGGLVAGVLLLVFGGMSTGKSKEGKEQLPAVNDGEILSYQSMLEEKVTALVEQVAGAGKASAAVTLSGGFEYVYAQNMTDKGGNVSSTYILVGSGSSESAVYLRVKTPTIAGIGIVCDGGGDAAVRREIVELLSAAFGLGSNRIYVTGRG